MNIQFTVPQLDQYTPSSDDNLVHHSAHIIVDVVKDKWIPVTNSLSWQLWLHCARRILITILFDARLRAQELFIKFELNVMENTFPNYTSTKSWRGYIFTAVCLCVCVCVCVSVSVCFRHFLWTKFQQNSCTDLDAVFAKWLLPATARSLMILVTLGQRSRSKWRNTPFFFIILC